ncbi:EEF1A lysine methyltransferase 1 [Stegostoma tigrinum]|uniref:EEF1A lysine methyltransferase 1 n=1 Tax=Stegostoma tigrinum TaxID=3053191 RepID=UPI00202AEE50|nr:EEF1A lysine methyltransferase 1 [Stegostoma tigrinum]XP_048388182.1 EEF1A lysine methyltransferase 1 [Stegostoma tigrinum]XP_048388183.1 EEF1A lysine methyltransferase 1 [Stegostoma tigrinum]
MNDSDDDNDIQLSAHALAALREFQLEQQKKQYAGLNNYATGSIDEDWQLSQFWYNDETALRLAQEAIEASGHNGKIACISTPSVYQKLKQLWNGEFSAVLLEYDRRFSVYGNEFVFYDYNNPMNLHEDLQPHSCDIVIVDPPYLSEECLSKITLTVKYLTKGKILLCTGAIMEDLAAKLLSVKMCKFLPKHNQNLANEFCCYTNYESRLDLDSIC